MTQKQLTACGFKLLLKKEDLKTEIEERVVLWCNYCITAENVDVYDADRNTSPFICSLCSVDEEASRAFWTEKNFITYSSTTDPYDMFILSAQKLIFLAKSSEMYTVS